MMDKNIQKILHNFILAVLAGISIGIGGTVYMTLNNKIVGALMFTVGLYTICTHGLNLFTGKVGYLINQPFSYLLELVIIWIGNLVGTEAAAIGIQYTRINSISKIAEELCQTKLEDNFLSLFILAIFCGFLMFTAVDGYRSSKNPAILFVCVASFILCGFEHCIADMFYFSVSNHWSWSAFLRILIISLGNSAGSFLIPLSRKCFSIRS